MCGYVLGGGSFDFAPFDSLRSLRGFAQDDKFISIANGPPLEGGRFVK